MISPNDRVAYKLLAASGAISSEILDRALKLTETSKQSFWKNLSETSGMGDAALYEILSKQTGVPVVPLKKIAIDAKALAKVPVKIAWYYKFFPYKIEDGKVWVAVSQVPDVSILDEIRFGIGVDVMVSFASEKDIEEMLNKHYGLGADMVNKIISAQSSEAAPHQAPVSTHQVEDLEKLADTASVAQLVNQIILEAYRKGASDIHLEPFRGKVRLRYRIDGVLHEAPVPGDMKKFFGPILSRIKIMSNLNVVEKRMPQDGKMRVKTQDQNIDLRVSSIPTAHGESMVIRILPGKNVWSMDTLGFDAEHLKLMKALLEKPNGVLFVTGPTGSGKSTTLYACLTSLNSEERKIITIEDPVEYELEGISQIQVASDIGLGFSQGLRSVLRHDPDVLMVGEVRDLETADISIRAALTGHLILSTLHTNDAASGITRLTDIGVEKYLVASSVIAFIAQRLVRVICKSCKEPKNDLDPQTREQMIQSLGHALTEKMQIFHGKGCDRCNGTGFAGRQAIHEILVINDEIRRLIMEGEPAGSIKLLAMQQGMQTLRQDGFKKVLEGVTTPEEIMRVAPSDHEKKENMPFLEEEMNELINASESPQKFPAPEEPDSQGHNQRKYKRVPIQLPLTYRVIEHHSQRPQLAATKELISNKEWKGEAKNISAGGILYSSENSSIQPGNTSDGMSMTLGEIVEVGSVLDLQIQIPDGESPVKCVGRVLRVSRSVKATDEGSKFIIHIAVLFLVINSTDRLRIEKFCANAESKA